MLEKFELKIDGDADLVSDFIINLEYYESLDALDALTATVECPTKDDFETVAKKLVAGAPFALKL